MYGRRCATLSGKLESQYVSNPMPACAEGLQGPSPVIGVNYGVNILEAGSPEAEEKPLFDNFPGAHHLETLNDSVAKKYYIFLEFWLNLKPQKNPMV